MAVAEWTPRLRIEQAGSEILQGTARALELEEVQSAEIQRLIQAMFATLSGVGVGLAAPQVGIGLQIVVVEDSPEYQAGVPADVLRDQERVPVPAHVLINPTLTLEDGALAEYFEGCLSVEGYRAIVPRSRRVRVRAWDRSGEPFEQEATGWYARILQHEVDHLGGRLYLERMLPRTFVSAASAAQRWSNLPIEQAKRLLGATSRPAH
ncbi:MAG: peptide deformylase [Chloroflexota bacterium]|nr:peptide deformylase [Chloroflexota bacterium]